MTTCSTASGFTRASSSAALMAIAPSSLADKSLNRPNPGVPQYSAIAVRLPPTITISCALMSPALPFGLTLLEERLQARFRVFRRAREAEEVGLELLRGRERHRAAAPHRVEDEGPRDRSLRGDLLRELERRRH